jgi:hypothetical protein
MQGTNRVLIVGRSPSALLGAVERLRSLGYAANASNQFSRLLDDYDVREIDLILFGGLVPPEIRSRVESEAARLNPSAHCESGRGGLAPLLAAQVQEHFHGPVPGVAFIPDPRSIGLRLAHPATVRVDAWWGELVQSDVVAHSVLIHERALGEGSHIIPIPADVPDTGSFAGVAVGAAMSIIEIGTASQPAGRPPAGQLPPPEPVNTRLPWS